MFQPGICPNMVFCAFGAALILFLGFLGKDKNNNFLSMKVKSLKIRKIPNSRLFRYHNENYVETTRKCISKSDSMITVEMVGIDKLGQPQPLFSTWLKISATSIYLKEIK
jgi:hypothetical protein